MNSRNDDQSPPRRLRRLHRVWPDRDGNISYLLTLCIESRCRCLNNRNYFESLVSFLLDSPTRYDWYPRRFVVMPDHLHFIASRGQNALVLSEWIKALKAATPGLTAAHQQGGSKRVKRSWRWQEGFHDHKFRSPESEARKWEYVCLNPVRYGLVAAPEHWPYGGEIFHDDPGGTRIVRGTPPLLSVGLLIQDEPNRRDTSQ